ncbi:four helix bundle protein [uncultured Megasphaera sp.]|uniref:four helix bundle protein n=1 Tax=uncultured Megasphaera sp. TaxID=165188 RepID=UPI0034591ECB
MRRVAVLVPSNIAEGQVRRTDSEVSYFLYISKGSIAEIETQLRLYFNFIMWKRMQYVIPWNFVLK